VKWFNEEEKTIEALALRAAHVEGHLTLLTTPLLQCEVANALRYKPDCDLETFLDSVNYLLGLHLREVAVDVQLLSSAGEIAFRSNVTIYDAIPVAVAVLKKTICITADKETQYARLKPKNYPVELL
jgi:predicted nucleic acid-binding protein